MTGEVAIHAAWALLIAYALSLAYEIYRATVKRGTSRHDSPGELLRISPLYVVAAVIIGSLFSGAAWASWAGLIFAVVMIVASIIYYNPVIMLDRRPRLVDWFEDLVYTGLLFVAAVLLLYDVGVLPTMVR